MAATDPAEALRLHDESVSLSAELEAAERTLVAVAELDTSPELVAGQWLLIVPLFAIGEFVDIPLLKVVKCGRNISEQLGAL